MDMMDSLKDSSESVTVELSAAAVHQKALIRSLNTIPNSLKNFITTVIDIAIKNGPADSEGGKFIVGRTQIQQVLAEQGNGASDGLISRRLTELKNANICSVEMTTLEKSQKRNRYRIESFADLALIVPARPAKASANQADEDRSRRRRAKTVVNAQRELFADDRKGLLLSGPEDIIFFNEQLFNGILDTSMRVSSRDERKSIAVTYQVAGHPLRITSSCSAREGSGLLMMTDQRAMRCIIAYCKKRIEHLKLRLTEQYGENFDRRFIPNVFHLDINELCGLMDLVVSSVNLTNVVAMMERLSDTTFEVDASENPWFRDSFSMLFREVEGEKPLRSDRYKIQFLNNFESASENENLRDLFGDSFESLRPRFYTFSLEARLFYSLISDDSFNLFLSHEELSSERSGIVQRFYNWARAYLSGRYKAGIERKWFTLQEMHGALTPGHRIDNFRNHFLNALEKFAVNDKWKRGEGGTSLIYGYYVHYRREEGEDLFQIQRDKDDPIVGDNSRHNVLLRQAQIGLLDSREFIED